MRIFTHIEMSPLPMKGCKFRCMLGNHCHRAVRKFYSHSLRWETSRRTCGIHTCCRVFSNLTVNTCFSNLGLLQPGFKHPTFRMHDKHQCWIKVTFCRRVAFVYTNRTGIKLKSTLLWHYDTILLNGSLGPTRLVA